MTALEATVYSLLSVHGEVEILSALEVGIRRDGRVLEADTIKDLRDELQGIKIGPRGLKGLEDGS